MTRLHAEVTRTINFYRSQQGGSQPSMVLLAGGCSVIPHVNTFLKEKLKMEVDFLNPFRNVAVNAGIPSDKIGAEVHLLGEVVGLALRRSLSCPVEINLLPPELVARKVFQRRLPFLAMAAMGLILIMLVFWIFLHRMRSMAEDRLGKVKSRVEQLTAPNERMNELGKQSAEVLAKAGTLGDLILTRTRWATLLNDFHSRLIDGMWLTSVQPAVKTENGVTTTRLVIQGMGFSDKVTHQAISEFAASLKGTGYISEDVQIRKIKPVSGTDYVSEFVIDAGLNEKPATPAEKPAQSKDERPAGN
jgi:Tfp pilus assembly protein PilN